MTFNLRFENDRDGENIWRCRRDLVVAVVRDHAPAILGTQEGMAGQLEYLQEHLPGYRMHAPDREWDATCQYPTLFYREDRFRVCEGGEFWLSRTPTVHRSKDWDSAFPRMMSHALFEELHSKRRLRVIVTHLDHLGAQARREQAKILVRWMENRTGPLLLMGDFNASPESDVHRLLTAPSTGLQDTWQVLDLEEGEESMTHHGFQGIPEKTRLDWILVNRQLKVLRAMIVRDHRHGRYPSDHFPYLVDLQWA